MLTLFIVAIVNGIIWFVLGYKFGKDSGQYYSETELIERKVKEKRSLVFKFTPSTNNLTPKTFSHEIAIAPKGVTNRNELYEMAYSI